MMKKTMVILLACLFIIPCFARHLKLKPNPVERSMPFMPIVADVDDNNHTLSLLFMEKMGGIWVEVTNENGNVAFAGIVEADSSTGVIIPLPDNTESEYQLFITIPNGSKYSSKFELY